MYLTVEKLNLYCNLAELVIILDEAMSNMIADELKSRLIAGCIPG